VTARVRLVVAAALPEVVQHPFGPGPGVRKHERVGVFGDEFVELGIKAIRHDAARRVYQVVGGTAQLDVELPDEPRVDDLELAGPPVRTDLRSIRSGSPTDQKLADRFEGFDGRRTADPGRRGLTHPFEPFQRDREMRPAFVVRKRVDLVDDHVLDRFEFPFEFRAVEQDCERLRRRVEYVWRLLEHPSTRRIARVAVSDRVADLDRFAARFEPIRDPFERLGQVPVDVVGERFQRRDVQTVDAVFEPLVVGHGAPEEIVDNGGKRRQRLSRPRRRTDQGVRPLVDPRDRPLLWRREEPAVLRDELAELLDPPRLHVGGEPGERVGVVDRDRLGVVFDPGSGEPLADAVLGRWIVRRGCCAHSTPQ